MATILGTVLRAAQLGAPRTDRAFDRKHPEWERLAKRYARTRHPSDLAALPLREGQTPRLYGLAMLTPEAYAAMQSEKGAARLYFLVCVAVVEIAHPDGRVERPAKTEKRGELTVASMEWVAKLQALGGLGLVDELGHLIERRAVIGDIEPEEDPETGEIADPLDRYGLPPGVVLGL